MRWDPSFYSYLAAVLLFSLQRSTAVALANADASNLPSFDTYCVVSRNWMSRRFNPVDCAGALRKLHLGDTLDHGSTEIEFLMSGADRNPNMCNQIVPRRYVSGQ